MKKLFKITVLSAMIGLSGCATIVSDSKYPVSVQSNPAGAEFTITNKAGSIISKGQTPQVVELKAGAGYFKKEKYTIFFNKPGFAGKIITVESSVDGWYVGNILFGGLIGLLIVDPATGAMYKLPSEVSTTLEQEIPTQKGKMKKGKGKKALNIMDINTLTAEQRSRLEPITL